MKIKDIRIQNYKSWYDSGTIQLHEGFNIIVGQNNVEKTAFLEALSLQGNTSPHKTLATKPERDSPLDPYASLSATLEFSDDELWRLALTLQGEIFVPFKNENVPITEVPKWVEDKLKEPQEIKIQYSKSPSLKASLHPGWYSPARHYTSVRVNESKLELLNPTTYQEGKIGVNKLPEMLADMAKKKIYLLRAERYNTSQANIQHAPEVLENNSNNLANVLHHLQASNRPKFNRILSLLQKIFPQITDISTPVRNATAHIEIWTIDPDLEREDLTVPLAQSGTGIGQVLAMLYLIVTSQIQQVILIDEPQSFLHPGAIRSLMEILYSYKKHQYIITTHSPHLLSFPTASIIHITLKDNQSSATVINSVEADKARFILQDIGFKLSDIFGADNILWVEGPTEEHCFKTIIRTLIPIALYTTEIIAVRSTGKLQGKNAESAYDIYSKLSQGIGIIPTAVGFILDSEDRSDADMKVLTTKSKNRLHFLPRKMYENYLIHPKAISSLLNELTQSKKYTESMILKWLEKNRTRNTFIKEKQLEQWDKFVDGAALLKTMFNELTKTKVTYDKVPHGRRLTEIILQDSPQDLREVKDLINKACALTN